MFTHLSLLQYIISRRLKSLQRGRKLHCNEYPTAVTKIELYG